jgi:Xaa-Pro aminopeptidase
VIFLSRTVARLFTGAWRNRTTTATTEHLPNLRYLVGFRGTAGSALLTGQTCHLFLDGRYRLYGESLEADDVTIELIDEDRMDSVADVVEDRDLKRLHLERDRLSYSRFRDVVEKTTLKDRRYGDDWVSDERTTKDEAEVRSIKSAIDRTLDLFDMIDTWIEPGLTETELSRGIRRELESRSEGQAFDPLILFGERTANPHAPTEKRVLEEGDSVLVDMGLKVNGYCSDLTRMFFCGERESPSNELYDLSKRAAAKALPMIEPGVSVSKVAGQAHNVIRNAGHDGHIRHGLGHGVGLNVHEAPKLSESSDDTLEAGMVVTLEPGIYIDGVGGGRVEHMALVTEEGAEILDDKNQYME